MKKIVAYLCIIVLLLPATLVLPISAERVIDETIDSQSCDWPMYQHDLANTGYSPSKIPNELQPIWCKKIGDEALFYFNPPVVTDGKVFTISNQGVVYALDENNGSLIWKQRLLFRALYECASGCAPAVANGKVFVTCSTFFNLYGKIYALDADMGDIIWEHEILGGTSFSSPIATDGKVFVAAHLGVMGVIPKGMLYVFDENDGHLIWCRFLLGYPESTPAVVDDKVFIVTTPAPSFTLFFIGGGGQNYPFRQTSWVYSFNVDDGRMIWATPILGKAKSSPVIANGKLFVTSMYFIPPTCESIVYALEKDTGEKVWNRTVSEVKMESISHSISTPAVAYGKVFMVAIAETGESKIYVLSENDGHMIWNRSLKGLIFLSPPAIADGKVFVRGGIVLDEEGMEGMYFVFNESDGSLIWIWNSSIMNCAPCAIANEKIFITSGDGVICALGSFNIISGQLEKSSLVKMTEKRQINVGSVVTSDFYDFLAMKSIYSTSENEKIATIRYMRDIPQHYHVFSRLVVIPNIIANAEVEVNYLRR